MNNIVNPYHATFDGVAEFMRTVRPPRNFGYDWKLIAEPQLGQINGIPTMRGFAIATNFLMVAIEQSDGNILFGHLAFFVPDSGESFSLDAPNRVGKTNKRKQKILTEYD